jgi:hypothetical protein
VTNKIAIITERAQEFAVAQEIPIEEVSMKKMVLQEVESGVANSGKQDGTGKSCASRTLLRLMWFLDFVGDRQATLFFHHPCLRQTC